MVKNTIGFIAVFAIASSWPELAAGVEHPPDGLLEITVQQPKVVFSQEPVLLTVVATNRRLTAVNVWPMMAEWQGNLRSASRVISLEHRPPNAAEFQSLKLDASLFEGCNCEQAIYELKPGETVTWKYSLRQLFRFPKDDTGDYRLRFEVEYSHPAKPLAKKDAYMFCIVAEKGVRESIGEYAFAAKPNHFYPGRAKEAGIVVKLERRNLADRRQLLASSNLRFSKGRVALIEGGAELEHINIAHFQPRQSDWYGGTEPNSVSYREFLGMAWVDGKKLKYTAYGIHALSGWSRMHNESKPYPDELIAVPDCEQFCQAKILSTPGDVKEILKIEPHALFPMEQAGPGTPAPPGYILIHYRAGDNSTGVVCVDEYGKQTEIQAR